MKRWQEGPVLQKQQDMKDRALWDGTRWQPANLESCSDRGRPSLDPMTATIDTTTRGLGQDGQPSRLEFNPKISRPDKHCSLPYVRHPAIPLFDSTSVEHSRSEDIIEALSFHHCVRHMSAGLSARLPVKMSLNVLDGHDVSNFVFLPFVQQDLIHVN